MQTEKKITISIMTSLPSNMLYLRWNVAKQGLPCKKKGNENKIIIDNIL